jgi:hypothetical protein
MAIGWQVIARLRPNAESNRREAGHVEGSLTKVKRDSRSSKAPRRELWAEARLSANSSTPSAL